MPGRFETMLTENGFTPEQEAALLAAEWETEGEKVFDRWDDAIAYLKAVPEHDV